MPQVGRFLEGVADAMDVVHDVKGVSRVTGNSRDAWFLIACFRAAETFRNACVHLPTQVVAFLDREFAKADSEVEYEVRPAPAGLRVKKDEPPSATYKKAPYLAIHIARAVLVLSERAR